MYGLHLKRKQHSKNFKLSHQCC